MALDAAKVNESKLSQQIVLFDRITKDPDIAKDLFSW